jgi:ribonuclease D
VRTRRGLAVVRELWTVRDQIARDADLSPRRVLTDQAIIEAARLSAPGQPVAGQPATGLPATGLPATGQPAGRPQLDKITGFRARHAREHRAKWLAAVVRARDLPDDQLPDVTGAPAVAGPPPAHRWAERDPAAAARLAAARDAVAALAEAHRLPAENLLAPDAVRRLSWEPPSPVTAETVAAALAGYGARPWQAGLTAEPLARAFAGAAAGYSGVADNGIGSAGDHAASGELT